MGRCLTLKTTALSFLSFQTSIKEVMQCSSKHVPVQTFWKRGTLIKFTHALQIQKCILLKNCKLVFVQFHFDLQLIQGHYCSNTDLIYACNTLFYYYSKLLYSFLLAVVTSVSLPCSQSQWCFQSDPDLCSAAFPLFCLLICLRVCMMSVWLHLHFLWSRPFVRLHVYTRAHTRARAHRHIWVCVISSVLTSGSSNLILLGVIYSCCGPLHRVHRIMTCAPTCLWGKGAAWVYQVTVSVSSL